MEPNSISNSDINGHESMMSPNHSIEEDPSEDEYGFSKASLESALQEKSQVSLVPLIHRFLAIIQSILCSSNTFRTSLDVSPMKISRHVRKYSPS